MTNAFGRVRTPKYIPESLVEDYYRWQGNREAYARLYPIKARILAELVRTNGEIFNEKESTKENGQENGQES